MDKIKTFLIGLFFENNEPSLTRVIIGLSFICFIAVSVYICLKGVHWDNYSTFAAITGGGSIGGKVADKVVAVIKGSPDGQMPSAKNQ